MKRFLKTLNFENGKIFACVDGDRYLIAEANPTAEIHELVTPVKAMGETGVVKSFLFSIIICPAPDFKRKIDNELLNKVSRFEITAYIFKPNGEFENIRFDDISLVEIQPDGNWTFECENQQLIRKIVSFFPSINEIS